jgi:hypothetical protein
LLANTFGLGKGCLHDRRRAQSRTAGPTNFLPIRRGSKSGSE